MSVNKLKEIATGNGSRPAKTIGDIIKDPKTKAQIAMALPKHLTADRLSRIVLTEIRKTPKLATCDQKSFIAALLQCAQLGLEPGDALGHAYLIPFYEKGKGNVAKLMIGYRGMIDLARRSGQVISISARAVYRNDEFSYAYGLSPDIKHIPSDGVNSELTHVYAVANLRHGGVQFEVMSTEQVNEIMRHSKAANSGPWVTHYEEMAKKTVIRRLFKYLPVSVEMQRAVILDEQCEAGISQDYDIITDEYCTTEEDNHVEQSDQQSYNLFAVKHGEELINSLNPGMPDAKAAFDKAEKEIKSMKSEIPDETYQGYMTVLNDMRAEFS